MDTFFQGLILGFREGLEAFLIVVILLKFLEKSGNRDLRKNVWHGLFFGIALSVVFGAVLVWVSSLIGGADATAKLWESAASLVAVILITTFLVMMINHGSSIKRHIEGEAALNLTRKGIFLVALFMVAREGVEIALFQFAGKYALIPIFTGIALSICLTTLVYHSLVKVKIGTIFNITMAYLILQAGFLLGYSIHEGLSASKDLGLISGSNPVYAKAFDASGGAFDHKTGAAGIPLYITFGWYSKPEWIQFFAQYILTTALFWYWYRRARHSRQSHKINKQ